MKTLTASTPMNTFNFAMLIITASTWTVFGQGQITFGNHIPGILKAPIYGPEVQDPVNNMGDWAYAKTGNTATGIPAGTQIYYGTTALGLLVQGWSVSFWAAFPGADPTRGFDFVQGHTTTPVMIGTGADAGFFSTTPVTFFLLPSTGQATVQIRVWDSGGGTRTWWDAYLSGGPLLAGASALFTADIGGTALGFRSFSAGFLDPLTLAPPVPEPTTFCLFVVGLLLLGSRFWKR